MKLALEVDDEVFTDTVYVSALLTPIGVPVIAPVEVLYVSPVGRVGEIE